MEHEMNMMILLVIFTLIGQSFSAVLLKFEKQVPREYYFNSRGASVYRGLLLSYTSAEKHQKCKDLYSETGATKTKGILSLFRSENGPKITDDENAVGDPKHSTIVGRISVISRLFRPTPAEKYEDLFFKCLLLRDSKSDDVSGKGSSIMAEYYISSAYQSGIMYASLREYTYGVEINIALSQYMLISPEYEPLPPKILEMKYVITRGRIKTLENESKDYINLVEQQDDISELSPWQIFLLCSSIIFSPSQGRDFHKFSLDWSKHDENIRKKDAPIFEKLLLSFENGDLKNAKWTADCVNCWSTMESGGIFSKKITNLLFTRSYNDKHAIYVLTQTNGITNISAYIKNVPMLKNARVAITDDPPPEEPVSEEYHH